MKRLESGTVRLAATLVLVACAVFTAFWSGQRIGFFRGQIDARQRELGEMQRFAGMVTEHRDLLKSMNDVAAPDQRLEQVIKKTLSDVPADLILQETRTIGDGWTRHRYDLRLERVLIKNLAPFLADCERAHPPIHIEEIQVTSLNEDGFVKAQLTIGELVPPAQ